MKDFKICWNRFFLNQVFLLMVCFFFSDFAKAQTPPPSPLICYSNQWGSVGSGNGYFCHPNDVVVFGSNVYVSENCNNRIQVFNTSGTWQATWGSYGSGNGQFFGPQQLATDAAGNIYVADSGNNRIQVFNSGGSFLRTFGTYGIGNGQFHSPNGVGVDSVGNIYVADEINERIQKFNYTGTYLSQWGTLGSGNGQFIGPVYLSLDASNNVYVTDTGNSRIQKFDSNGNFVTKWGSNGSGNGQFSYYAYSVMVGPCGNVFVSDYGYSRIQEFDPNGTYLNQYGSAGSGNGQFSGIQGIAFDSANNVYVVDVNNNRLQKFSSCGMNCPTATPTSGPPFCYATQWGNTGSGNGQFSHPNDVMVLGSNVYVSDQLNSRIQVFNANGTWQATWGSSGLGNGQFRAPQQLAADAAGNIYVADMVNNRIQVLSSSGIFLRAFGTSGTGNGQFNNPAGVGVDSTGNIYVADLGNNRIQKFNSVGTYLSQWGTLGSGNGQFSSPVYLSLDASNNVYVSDTGNSRIQKFDSNGNFITKWGSNGTGNGQFSTTAYAVMVGPCGNVYVSDYNNNRIQDFDPNGNYLNQYGTAGTGNGQFGGVQGIAFDSSNNLYEVEVDNNRLQKFSPCGMNCPTATPTPTCGVCQGVAAAGTPGVWGSGTYQFHTPLGLASDGTYYYVGDINNYRIQKYRLSDNSLAGSYSGSPYNFALIEGLTTDGNGDLFVADANANHVLKINTTNGSIVSTVTDSGFNGPFGVTIGDDGYLYVCDRASVRKFQETSTNPDTYQEVAVLGGTSSGQITPGQTPTMGSGLAQFSDAFGVMVKGGYVEVADHDNNRVQRWKQTGLNTYAPDTSLTNATVYKPSQVLDPMNLALSPTGLVYITYSGSGYDVVNTSTSPWTRLVNCPAAIQAGGGIAFDLSSGNAYLTDPNNFVVNRFPPPQFSCYYQVTLPPTDTPTPTPISGHQMKPALFSGQEGGQTPTPTPTPDRTLVPISTPVVELTRTPTFTPSPTATPTPSFSGLVMAVPNVSRNGEPIKFLVNLDKPSQIRLSLFSITGENVFQETTMGTMGLNAITWGVKNQAGSPVASGLYVYQLQADDGVSKRSQTGKVAVLH